MVSGTWLASRQLQEAKEATIPIEFPRMHRVHLEDLSKLKGFSTGDSVEWPSLENVVVNHCPELQKFGLGKIEKSQLKSVILENQEQVDIYTKVASLFELSDQLSTIAEYSIDDSQELSKALDNLQPSHFTNLIRLQAKSCDERLNKLLSILIKRSNLLEHLVIEQCKTLEHLFDLDELIPDKDGNGKYFTLIKTMILMELPHLTSIWSKDPTGIFGLGNLQMIRIQSCPSLQNVITPSAAEKLQQLKELKIHACDMLEQVVGMGTQTKVTIKFPALNKVELTSLSKLIMFHSQNLALEFPALKTLMIEKCPQLKAFTAGIASTGDISTTDGKSFSLLDELKMDSCNDLVCVISSNTLQEFEKLKKLTVSKCNSLKTVFKIQGEIPQSMKSLLMQLSELNLTDLPNLIQVINKEVIRCYENLLILRVKQCKSLNCLAGSLMLTNIEISDCEALEKIIVLEEGEEMREKTILSQLKYVALENLATLSTFFPWTSEFPSLETLIVANCPALKTFVEGPHEMKDPPSGATSNYFFPNWLSLEKLKELHVINQDIEKLWHESCPSKSFCELEELILSNNNKLLGVISSSMMIRYNNLKNVTVDKCELLTEVFNIEDDKTDQSLPEMLPGLRGLVLSNLNGLMHVWNKEPQVPFFLNLVSLHIVHCGCLKTVFSLSAAKNLNQLKVLKLYNCEKMEEVISGVSDEKLSITLPEVECLVLKDLPSLVSFCQLSNTFEWPKLQTVRVSNIPSMKTFAGIHHITPLLRTVFITFVEKCWHGNLNSTISYLHESAGSERSKVIDDLDEEEDKVQKTKPSIKRTRRASSRSRSSTRVFASTTSEAPIQQETQQLKKEKEIVANFEAELLKTAKANLPISSPIKFNRIKHTTIKGDVTSRDLSSEEESEPSQAFSKENLTFMARSSSMNQDLTQESKENQPVTSRRSKTPSPPLSPLRDNNIPSSQQVLSHKGKDQEIAFKAEVPNPPMEIFQEEIELERAQVESQEEVLEKENKSSMAPQAKNIPASTEETTSLNLQDLEAIGDTQGSDNLEEDDPLKILEEILNGKTSSKSHHSTTQLETEVQSILIPTMLQELDEVLSFDLEQLASKEHLKQKLNSLLAQLGSHKQHLALDAQHIINRVHSFFEDLLANFPGFHQIILDHQQLVQARAQLIENMQTTKDERTRIETTFTSVEKKFSSNESRIADLKAELLNLEKEQTKLQGAIDGCKTQKKSLMDNTLKWVEESKTVMAAISVSMHAFKNAINTRKIAEDSLQSLRFSIKNLRT